MFFNYNIHNYINFSLNTFADYLIPVFLCLCTTLSLNPIIIKIVNTQKYFDVVYYGGKSKTEL